MAQVSIKKVKVTGWHTDKDGDEVARLKITLEGDDVTGKMHAYVSRAQLDSWSASLAAAQEREITLDDLHDPLYAWLFC